MNLEKTIIIALIISSGILFYISAEDKTTESVLVTRAIDGDTLEIEGNVKVRLKGINTPENGEPFYEEAKNFLKELENKTVEIEYSEYDRYGRILAHIKIKKESINKMILQNGLGHLYYYEKDSHYKDLKNAEEFARKNEVGIWKRSKNSHCVELIELDYYDKNEETELLILENSCETLDIKIKDDATHIYAETLQNGIFEKVTQNIWNDDGDSLYVYDDSGMILFHRY